MFPLAVILLGDKLRTYPDHIAIELDMLPFRSLFILIVYRWYPIISYPHCHFMLVYVLQC